ncbi:hypothetical protein DIPPA_15380 [Diplonema papillatum]|nr:hypothetical protein DIPPA_15380 [Diplonema papillatum]
MLLLFPDLGDVCTAPMCGKYDLLPFTCKFCKGATCSAHQQCEGHASPDAPTSPDDLPPEPPATRAAATWASPRTILHAKCEACARTLRWSVGTEYTVEAGG